MNNQDDLKDEREVLLETVNRVFNTGPTVAAWTDQQMQCAIERLGELQEDRALEPLSYLRDHFGGDYPTWADAAIRRIKEAQRSG